MQSLAISKSGHRTILGTAIRRPVCPPEMIFSSAIIPSND
jgi:hypothetical protein